MAHPGAKPHLKAIDGGLTGIPAMPKAVHETMRPEWEVICADLRDRKLLTAVSVSSVETYVIAMWSIREAQKAIEEHGMLIKTAHNMLKANPACAVIKQSGMLVARLASELGLTPAARSRAGMGSPEAPDPDLEDLGI